ncbi:MAG: rod shape-determining protein MreC [Ferruginibacter sp.]
MRNVFLFIRRYSTFLFFLLLQGLSIYFMVHYQRYHNVMFSSTWNEITGRVNVQYNKVENYIQLKKSNDDFKKQNERLLNQLSSNFETPDTANRMFTDPLPIDTLGTHRKWYYREAKVIGNSIVSQDNFIQLHRGSNQELKKDMGVVDLNNGVVGKITDVSENFAVVMSLLNKDSKISARMKNSPESGGTVIWDGKEANRLTITDIKQSVVVKVGDTVVTTGFTDAFPYGLLIGTVKDVVADKGSNNYIIHIKSTANFYNLQYVYTIDNLQKDELNKLIDKSKKKTN